MRKQVFIAAFAISLLSSFPVNAQTIESGTLSDALAFDAGMLNSANGGLDQALWDGTSAARAVDLLSRVPVHTVHPAARDLVRVAVLSEGIPPQTEPGGDDSIFQQTRFKTIIDLGEMASAQALMGRSALATNSRLRADMALLSGDNEAACQIADNILEGRAEPQWARLRSFCHILRDEIPAAELTAELLKNQDYDDPAFFSLMGILTGVGGAPKLDNLAGDPLHIAMMDRASVPWPDRRAPKVLAARTALNPVATAERRLLGLYAAGPALSDMQMGEILKTLAQDPETSEGALAGGGGFDLASANNAQVPTGTGQLYVLAITGEQQDRPAAVKELLQRADMAGAFARFAELLTPQIQTLSPEEQITADLSLFVRAAIHRGDISALQQFYQILEDQPDVQERLALAADALGYGFLGNELGTDIERRLNGDSQTKARAVRDVFIALALGANLSDNAAQNILNASEESGRAADPGKLLALRAAARSGSRAETALQAAEILSGLKLDDTSLYTLIDALSTAGLNRHAAKIAALDFWEG